jgi:hypothetical protein
MPTVSCDGTALLKSTELSTDVQFEDLCFDFGIELEGRVA